MTSNPFSPIHEARQGRLAQKMKEQGLAALIIEDGLDIFYLTGFHASLAMLILAPSKGSLFVDGRYRQKAKEQVAFPIGEYETKAIEHFLRYFQDKKVGFDSAKTTYKRALALRQIARHARTQLAPLAEPLKTLRTIKDAQEIAALKKSALLNKRAYEYLLTLLKPGITERELASAYTIFCLQQGAQKLAFDPIIAFGPGSALPHYQPGNIKLKVGDLVLLDLGVMVEDYASDMTRVVLPQNCSSEIQKIHDTVIAAYDAAAAICYPGTPIGALDCAARKVMRKAGLEEFFVHGLGHGIGLEVHEFPRIKFNGADRRLLLEPGMAITIEPGLYLPGKGGVRYENTIIVTAKGHTNLYL